DSNDKKGNPEQRAENAPKLNKAFSQLNDWKGVVGTYDDSKKALDDQFKLVAPRRVWPMIWADVMAALPQAQAQAGAQNMIVITEMDSQYEAHLTEHLLDPGGTAGVAAAPAPQPAGGGAPVPLTEDEAMKQVPKQIGDSNHGYIVTITGYTPVPPGKKVD